MLRILGLLDRADPLPAGGEALERAVGDMLGPRAVTAGPHPGTLRIDVPLVFRGAGVAASYSATTFDRNVAIRFEREDVDLITPLHPLVAALRADARRRLLQVYAGGGALAPRRLAARRMPPGTEPAALFTFVASFAGGGDLVEEHLLAIRVRRDGTILGDPIDNLSLLASDSPGEVTSEQATSAFLSSFAAMACAAEAAAADWVTHRAEALRRHRGEQAATLRQELTTDLADRLREIDLEEKRARAQADAEGQIFLFEGDDTRSTPFAARRKAAQSQAEARRDEIAAYETLDEPSPPRPLGALFLLPEGAA
jgi:hypothetical protein